MKIQVIGYDKKNKYDTEQEYTYSTLNTPMTFDMFDINIISLQNEKLWTYEEANNKSIDSINDFKSLKELIGSTKKSKVILCFPQNYSYQYARCLDHYTRTCQLKDMLPRLNEYLKQLIPPGYPYEIVYENSETICDGTKYTAAFYFNNISDNCSILTKCTGGDHCTTYKVNSNLIFTTLDFSHQNVKINDFLSSTDLIQRKNEAPYWINDFIFLDDKKQENIVIEANNEIDKQKEKINIAQKKLQENLHYKSILFETGDALVKVVFEILERIFNIDLSDFVDKKQEDFKVSFENITFIGEIKGITSNVKSENISQLDVHCQIYNDSLDEDGKSENVKGLLIINPLRNKSPKERDEVHEKQIQLATRYGILIITTETLLLLFMAYLEGHITTDKIIELLKNKIGLLTHSDFV